MGVLFISHSSDDNAKAVRVRDWLHGQGWRDVFLDLDPGQGLAPGQRWQDELKRAGETCAAVLVLISPNWLASFWCRTEFLVADQLGKRIFPIFVAPTPFDDIPADLKAKFQFADISDPSREADGFQRLSIGLKRAGLDPKSFDWPPPGEPGRAVYRGLEPLDVPDAAIFFGRDAAITRGLDELRTLRGGAAERVLVILGASGAGKSSFLRAGLLSRLQRDEENFVVLPVIRPERAAISGAEGLAASLAQASDGPVALTGAADLVRAFADLRTRAGGRLSGVPAGARPPTVVIPIDQAEELLSVATTETPAFCALLANALESDANVVIILTIRSDSYEMLQLEPSLSRLPQRLFNLPPIGAGAFREVIEGPAKLATPPIAIEPELLNALLADLDLADALPLLAFTLERLQLQFGRGGALTLVEYRDELGGLAGALQAAVIAAMGAFPDAETLASARRLFVPALVQVDQAGVGRRIARRQDVPADTRDLADRFVAQRLLVTDRRTIDGRVVETLEVAHEALLRQWPTLASWIEEDREALRALEGVRLAAQEWLAHPGDTADAWLVHRGDRLARALAFAGSEAFAAAVDQGMRDYLAACRKAERRSASGRRRLQGVAGALAVAAIAAAGWIIWTQQAALKSLIAAYSAYRPYVTSSATLASAAPGTSFQDCRPASKDCPVMVVIPQGRFIMGSPVSEVGRTALRPGQSQNASESPQHPVSVARFAVSRYDITYADWAACVAASGCQNNPHPDRSGKADDREPVVNVSWDDAQDYTAWLSRMTGVKYRLLTEAEWEYAARGETTVDAPYRVFPWGDAVGVGNANCAGCGGPLAGNGTTPVGSFKPNAFGLYDMAGNVQQWLEDCLHKDYIGAPQLAYPPWLKEQGGYCTMRGLRGGDWEHAPAFIRSASRSGYLGVSPDFGFRVARSP